MATSQVYGGVLERKSHKAGRNAIRKITRIVGGNYWKFPNFEMILFYFEEVFSNSAANVRRRATRIRRVACASPGTAVRRVSHTLLERWPDDGPSRTFWKRCQEYLFEEPEPNWAVFVMSHKFSTRPQ